MNRSSFRYDLALSLGLAAALALPGGATADQVINDDLIVTFSECIGNDCVNGESFGFDTLRLKENNLRIHFDDTSTSASFPRNDWRLVANDTANGGQSRFSIEDSTAGRTPFTVQAGARNNALVVRDNGNVGFGTSTPVANLHTVTGNTPTLRLEQDGSSGFTPQTWDVAGNEAGFFVRDATNGSTLPFRIEPGVASGTLFLKQSGGEAPNPANGGETGPHILVNNILQLQSRSTSQADRNVLFAKNEGGQVLRFQNTNPNGNTWFHWFRSPELGGEAFLIGRDNPFELLFELDANGNVTTAGMVNGVSDRNAKSDIEPVDTGAVLDALSALPVFEWQYDKSGEARHIGPMAQDFHAKFGLGIDDKHLAPHDLAGVGIAAAQELDRRLRRLTEEVEAQKQANAALSTQLARYESALEASAVGMSTSRDCTE